MSSEPDQQPKRPSRIPSALQRFRAVDGPPLTPENYAANAAASRLSIPAAIRLPVASFSSFIVGACLGLVQGSKMGGLRFRAEHAHKLPQTTVGWYLYHKSKNYHLAQSGIREGFKMGAKVCFWTTAMFSIENLFDNYRGTMDVLNTVLASVTVAGGFSLWNRFPMALAARTTKTAIVVGVVYGGLQDLTGIARGRPIRYVDFIKRQFNKDAADADKTST